MKRLFLTFGIIGGFVINSYAGLITRTYTYTSGNTIVANENNTNENTLYTEINGNIESANIKDGTIVNADVADTTLDVAKFNAAAQSTFTHVSHIGHYRRPVLQYSNANIVNMESGLGGTASAGVILFPDGQLRSDTANTRINCDLTAVANFSSGSNNSGLHSGTVAKNTWYGIYAVKGSNSANAIVAVATTTFPTQANYASLNTAFGVDSWIYVGVVAYGDSSGTVSGILSFTQTGNMTIFNNIAVGAGTGIPGKVMAGTAGAATLTYTYSAGHGTTDIPDNVTMALFTGVAAAGGTGSIALTPAAGNPRFFTSTENASNRTAFSAWMPASSGAQIVAVNSNVKNISLAGFIDGALGIGLNPQL